MTRKQRHGLYVMLPGLLALVLLLVVPAQAKDGIVTARSAVKKDEAAPLPEKVQAATDYLHRLLMDSSMSFDQSRVTPLLEYVNKADFDPEKIEPEKRDEGTGALYYDEFRVPFTDLLRYFYNPDIPNFLIVPSVLRASGWQQGSDILTGDVRLWEELADYSQPIVLRGSEYEVNTPDSFGGCYYSYDLHRLLVLMKHNGQHVLLSVSKQKDKSDVGRKAVIIDDKDFVYFYSGIEGLDRGLIGWMDTYMYGSFAVQVYYEKGPDLVANALFKWLSAGWAGMNVVKRDHIYDGARRYAQGLKEVLESDNLPSPERFAERIRQIDALSPAQTDAYITKYARNFEREAKSHEGMDSSSFQEIIENGGYAEVLDPKARREVLYLEYMKSMLGKPCLVDLDLPEPDGPEQDSQAIEKAEPAEESVKPEQAANPDETVKPEQTSEKEGPAAADETVNTSDSGGATSQGAAGTMLLAAKKDPARNALTEKTARARNDALTRKKSARERKLVRENETVAESVSRHAMEHAEAQAREQAAGASRLQ